MFMVNVINDNDKFIRVALEFASKRGVFTSEMLYDYILNRDIKFHKSMTKRRIGFKLSTCDLFEKLYKKKNTNYYMIKENGVI